MHLSICLCLLRGSCLPNENGITKKKWQQKAALMRSYCLQWHKIVGSPDCQTTNYKTPSTFSISASTHKHSYHFYECISAICFSSAAQTNWTYFIVNFKYSNARTDTRTKRFFVAIKTFLSQSNLNTFDNHMNGVTTFSLHSCRFFPLLLL